MASNDPGAEAAATRTGPVLLAYDGSELAAQAVKEAGAQLAAGPRAVDGRYAVDALVLCVWQPVDVGFIPSSQRHFDPASAAEVKQAAEETAAYGASLAAEAGFHSHSLAIEASPIWQGIIQAAQEHHASLIVLGSHHRSGLTGHLIGSVAAEVSAHSHSPVLIVPSHSEHSHPRHDVFKRSHVADRDQ
jgi:nucleotide-binding universal stress UspA family protein